MITNDLKSSLQIEDVVIAGSGSTDLSDILVKLNVNYTEGMYHFTIGKTPVVEGWILHLSVVISQYKLLIETIVPLLVEENVAFRFARNAEIAQDFLDGHMGYEELGKIVSIYPENGPKANYLAKRIIEQTSALDGPRIPAGAHLEGGVYARFGVEYKLESVEPSEEPPRMTFDLPKGIVWPFSSIAGQPAPNHRSLLNKTYKPTINLKADARGDVFKAIYLKGLFNKRTCIIKQGRKNMASDFEGRTIRDRLIWQVETHGILDSKIPLPKVIDFFEEDGDTYIAIEFIKGISLHQVRQIINSENRVWPDMSRQKKLIILRHLIALVDIVNTIHAQGYVYRDITPVNVLVSDEDKLVLIDTELAYSLTMRRPDPPFGIGTPGFISPEQLKTATPTVKEDIYGLSATILHLLIGLDPIFLDCINPDRIFDSLLFFIGDQRIARLIWLGISREPERRPELAQIRRTLEDYRDDIASSKTSKTGLSFSLPLDANRLKDNIQRGIRNLVSMPIPIADGLWLSQPRQKGARFNNIQKSFIVSPDFDDGILGVLYVLAKAKLAEFDIEPCLESYRKGWDYLQANFINNLDRVPPGLYQGAAGISLALSAGMTAGLLRHDENTIQLLGQCCSLKPIGLGLATGIAGQGIATIRCRAYLPPNIAQDLLSWQLGIILKHQRRDGSWLTESGSPDKKPRKDPRMAGGVAGILWFMLEYLHNYQNPVVDRATRQGLNWLNAHTENLQKLLSENFNNKVLTQNSSKNDGVWNIALTFIKAFEVLKDERFRAAVESLLDAYPDRIVLRDFTQATGLAGIGEMYLEAWRVFHNDRWLQRAEWIASLIVNARKTTTSDSCFWVCTPNSYPRAGFMEGNCGLLYFLMRVYGRNQLGYRMLA